MCMFYPLKSEAVNIEYPLLSGKWFYIKKGYPLEIIIEE